MLEILYDTTNNEVRGWCADEAKFGNFQPKVNEVVVIWDIELPNYDSEQFYVDLATQTIIGEPLVIEPVVFHPTNTIHGLKARVAHTEEFLHELYPE